MLSKTDIPCFESELFGHGDHFEVAEGELFFGKVLGCGGEEGGELLFCSAVTGVFGGAAGSAGLFGAAVAEVS